MKGKLIYLIWFIGLGLVIIGLFFWRKGGVLKNWAAKKGLVVIETENSPKSEDRAEWRGGRLVRVGPVVNKPRKIFKPGDQGRKPTHLDSKIEETPE